ncbi:MAG: alpha/beta fold hydrolase [Rhizobiaceae bacterium]|nr:alpha/beta fold hydrolase [Rhizobiaceae bacterium]
MMESLEPTFESLTGWKRIYVDLPGHGLSPPQDSIKTQDHLLTAVIDFANQALPDKKFAIVGESRGSYLAHGFVHLHPERISGAALIVPGGSPSADPKRLPEHRVLQPDPSLREALHESELSRFDTFMVVQNRDIIEKMRRTKLPAAALCDADQAARIAKAFDFDHDKRGEKSQFCGPSLIVAGRQDSMSGYLDAVDLLPQFPRATLATLDAAGHGLTWERPKLFDMLLRDWLERLVLEY